MSYITMNRVNYGYQTYQKKSGIRSAIVDVFKRRYQQKDVLKDVSFTLEKGEKVGLLGPNGSGKSTIIKLLTGILQPEEGEVKVAGTRPDTNNATFLSKIGVVMGQKSQLNWNLPAADTFEMLKSIYKIDAIDYQQRLNRYLKMFRLEEVVYVPVRKLSLGERTKLEVIAALLHGPELLILDEPTIGMDIVSQRALHDFINKVNQTEGVTVLLISHQMTDIEAVTERMMVLLNGNIAFDGLVKTFVEKAQLKRPSIVIDHHHHQRPVMSSHHAQLTNTTHQTTISDYDEKASITLKLSDIQNIHIQHPSLEETLYQLFNERKD
ncbi:ABC transporter ATP-binding protein [Holzapfeliella sp. JNUCC 72]